MNHKSGQTRIGRPTMRQEELSTYNLRNKCTNCDIHGHWGSDHLQHGQIENNIPSIAANDQTNVNHHQNQSQPQNDGFSQHNSQHSTPLLNLNVSLRAFMTTKVANTTQIKPRI